MSAMTNSTYKKRLGQDLPAWQQNGWVTSEGAAQILASVESGSNAAFGLAAVIAVLGALLIGSGGLAFVGANWDYMPRLFRFGLLVACLGAAYGAAGVLQSKNMARFADAAVLLGGLVFAAAIALVGQTYHMAGDFADAILLWLVGALAAATLTRSVSGTVLALAGAAYWSYVVTVENQGGTPWGGLVLIAAGGALSVWLDSRLARRAAILALSFWIVVSVIDLGMRLDWPAVGYLALLSSLGLAVWAGGAAMTTLPAGSLPRTARLGQDLLTPAFGGFLLAAAAMQTMLFDGFGSRDSQLWMAVPAIATVAAVVLAALAQQRGGLRFLDVAATAILGAGVLGTALWTQPDAFGGRLAIGTVVILGAVWWLSLGYTAQREGQTLGLFAFGAELLYLYSVTLGSLIDTALAFLVGGVLFIALAFFLFRLNKKLAPSATP